MRYRCRGLARSRRRQVGVPQRVEVGEEGVQLLVRLPDAVAHQVIRRSNRVHALTPGQLLDRAPLALTFAPVAMVGSARAHRRFHVPPWSWFRASSGTGSGRTPADPGRREPAGAVSLLRWQGPD